MPNSTPALHRLPSPGAFGHPKTLRGSPCLLARLSAFRPPRFFVAQLAGKRTRPQEHVVHTVTCKGYLFTSPELPQRLAPALATPWGEAAVLHLRGSGGEARFRGARQVVGNRVCVSTASTKADLPAPPPPLPGSQELA